MKTLNFEWESVFSTVSEKYQVESIVYKFSIFATDIYANGGIDNHALPLAHVLLLTVEFALASSKTQS
jgi:hypothetical protein